MVKSETKGKKPIMPIYAEHKKPKSLVELRKILDRLKKR